MQDFRSLGEIINSDKEFKALRDYVNRCNVIENFFVLFPKLKEYVTDIKIENDTLLLSVSNSVTRSDIKIHQIKLMEKIEKDLNYKINKVVLK